MPEEKCKETKKHVEKPPSKTNPRRLKTHALHKCDLRKAHYGQHVCTCGWPWGHGRSRGHSVRQEAHIRPAPKETSEERQRRFEGQRAQKADRSAKLERTRHHGAHDDVALANEFRYLGLQREFLQDRSLAFKLVRERLEGKKWSHLPPNTQKFLEENFDVEQVEDSLGRILLHFKEEVVNPDMNLIKALTERSGQPRKVVKAVWEALLEQVRHDLKEDRGIRLPELGKMSIRYRPAKPKRKGINPFTRKKMTFKAKPASNKLRFTIFKGLREYVDRKIPVVAPPEKKGKKKDKDRHHKHHHKH